MVATVVQLVLLSAAGYATAHPAPLIFSAPAPASASVEDTNEAKQKSSRTSKDYVHYPDFETGKC